MGRNLATVSAISPTFHPRRNAFAILSFKALHTGHPPYIADLLQYHKLARSTRSSASHLLSLSSHSLCSFGSRAFHIAAPKIWNSLPREFWHCGMPNTRLFQTSWNFPLLPVSLSWPLATISNAPLFYSETLALYKSLTYLRIYLLTNEVCGQAVAFDSSKDASRSMKSVTWLQTVGPFRQHRGRAPQVDIDGITVETAKWLLYRTTEDTILIDSVLTDHTIQTGIGLHYKQVYWKSYPWLSSRSGSPTELRDRCSSQLQYNITNSR